jgi:NAD(P)-dependent dehydrogenase (short-subunit alcohol dehydrogenase family)
VNGPRVVLVTGAGGGIGSAVVRRFAISGWRVLLTDLDGAAVAMAAEEFGADWRVADLAARPAGRRSPGPSHPQGASTCS